MSLAKSPVSMAIIALNIAIYFLQVSNPAITPEYGLSTSNFQTDPWTAVTSGFLHADLMHLGMNMIAVLFLASGGWESLFGSWRYLIIYLASLLGGSAAVLVWNDPNTLTVGASGAIYGLMGAILGGVIRAHKSVTDLSGVLVPITGYIVINLGFTFANPSISWQAHVGGLIVGFLTALILGVKTPKQNTREVKSRRKETPYYEPQ